MYNIYLFISKDVANQIKQIFGFKSNALFTSDIHSCYRGVV